VKFLKALFNLPEFKAPEGMLHPNLMGALKTTPTPEAVFALLDEGQLRRLKSISIDHLGGMSIDFYEDEEKETGGYYHYPSPMGEMPTEPSGAFNRTLLEGMTVSQFTDLMTLTALHEDESFEFGFGDCAIWVEADPDPRRAAGPQGSSSEHFICSTKGLDSRNRRRHEPEQGLLRGPQEAH